MMSRNVLLLEEEVPVILAVLKSVNQTVDRWLV